MFVSVNRKIVAHYHIIIYAITNKKTYKHFFFPRLKCFSLNTSKMQNIR